MSWITLKDLRGLGQSDECGPAPTLQPGESKACCPNIGWVVYTGEESYGICERAAAAQAGGEAVSYADDGAAAETEEAAEAAPPASVATLSPLERSRLRWQELEERKRQIEERRIGLEEERHEEQVRSIVASIVAQSRMQQLKAELAKELPEARIKIQETTGALPLAVGTAGYVGYMLGGVVGAVAGAALSAFALTRS